jgi:hypothetical protein
LKPSVGFDNLVICFDKLFALSSQPIQPAFDIVVDFDDEFVRMEAENARLREVAKSLIE